MAYRVLEVTLLSAKGLKNVNLIMRMEVYAVVTISGEPLTRQCTQPDPYGGSHPSCNATFRFEVPPTASAAGGCLHVILRAERALGDRDVGEVIVPLSEIFAGVGADDLGPRPPQCASYQVRKVHRSEPRGVLSLSYRLGPVVAPVPHHARADEAVVAFPAPPPTHPPPYTYLPPPPPPPPQAAGHVAAAMQAPPQAAGGHVAAPLLPKAASHHVAAASPRTGKQNGKLDIGMGLGAGLVGGAIGGMLAGEMMSDAAAYNAGYRAGLAAGGHVAAPLLPKAAGHHVAAASPRTGKQNGKLDIGMGLEAGLVGGAIGGMLAGEMMSDAAAYNAGYRAGLADGGGAKL